MRRPASAVAAVLGAVVLLTPGLAQANWVASGTGSATIGARTIRNATALAAVCTANQGPDDATLSWTASADSPIVSYVVTRTGGAGTTITIPAAAGATSVADTNTNWNAAPGNFQYSYTIRAVVGTAPWTTTASAVVTRSFSKSGKCLGP
jgi:hypothetical protein